MMSNANFFSSLVSSYKTLNIEDKKNFLSEHKIANAFYEKSLQYYNKQEFLIAIFMMQQATRFAYYNILHIAGYSLIRYSELKVLREHISEILPDVRDVFLFDSEKDKLLFEKMDVSLPDMNFIRDFSITEEEITQLLDKVGELLKLSENYIPER